MKFIQYVTDLMQAFNALSREQQECLLAGHDEEIDILRPQFGDPKVWLPMLKSIDEAYVKFETAKEFLCAWTLYKKADPNASFSDEEVSKVQNELGHPDRWMSDFEEMRQTLLKHSAQDPLDCGVLVSSWLDKFMDDSLE